MMERTSCWSSSGCIGVNTDEDPNGSSVEGRVSDISGPAFALVRLYDPLYRLMGLAHIPKSWVFGSWTDLLDRLLREGLIERGRAIDLGCGVGEEALYLAQRGFEVTGLDISTAAIRLARRRAATVGAEVAFEVDDLTALEGTYGTFDLLVDLGTLNDIAEPHRDPYVETIASFSRPGSRFILLGFESKLPEEERRRRFGDRFDIETVDERVEPLFRRRMITSLLARK